MPGIFICYRRSDVEDYARLLTDSLRKNLERVKIFRDIGGVPLGITISTCDVLIALIGPHWLRITNDSGARRLDDPQDVVRLEIATALRLNVRVIPALVNGGTMPKTSDLPDDLKALCRLEASELTDSRWTDDCRTLADVLRSIVKPRRLGLRMAVGICGLLAMLVVVWFTRNTWLPIVEGEVIYEYPGGGYRKRGDSWVEFPAINYPGIKEPVNFRHKEISHTEKYIELTDESPERKGVCSGSLLTRLPMIGGEAQWTCSDSVNWTSFNVVRPARPVTLCLGISTRRS
jgi:hypothetical protein